MKAFLPLADIWAKGDSVKWAYAVRRSKYDFSISKFLLISIHGTYAVKWGHIVHICVCSKTRHQFTQLKPRGIFPLGSW